MNEFEVLFEALKITEPTLQKEILIHGSFRVWQKEEEREILLYYVNPLETCSLSLEATFKDYKSLVHARTENNTTLIKSPCAL